MNKDLGDEFSMWEQSPEGVSYALCAGTITEGIDHDVLNYLITMTVHKLPRDVQEFVCNQCTFVSVGVSNGAAFPPGWAGGWLIVLDSAMLDRFEEEETMSVIAHEIAHAWFRHSMFDPTISTREEQIENEAAKQAADWGFAGIGTKALKDRTPAERQS